MNNIVDNVVLAGKHNVVLFYQCRRPVVRIEFTILWFYNLQLVYGWLLVFYSSICIYSIYIKNVKEINDNSLPKLQLQESNLTPEL